MYVCYIVLFVEKHYFYYAILLIVLEEVVARVNMIGTSPYGVTYQKHHAHIVYVDNDLLSYGEF